MSSGEYSWDNIWNGDTTKLKDVDKEVFTIPQNELNSWLDWLNNSEKQVLSNEKTWTELANTLKENKRWIVQYGEETQGTIRTQEGLIEANKKAKQSVIDYNNSIKANGLGSKLKDIGMSALSMAGNMLIGMAVSAGIQLLITGLDNVINRTEKLIEAGQQAKDTISNIGDAYNAKKETVDNSKDRYVELSKGIDNRTNENLSLSTEEYEEFLGITNQLAQTFPSLVTGYDAQGNALLSLSGNADEIKKYTIKR